MSGSPKRARSGRGNESPAPTVRRTSSPSQSTKIDGLEARRTAAATGTPWLLAIVLIAIGCFWLNPLPMRGTDLWDHVNYGRVIRCADSWPTAEPLLPLAEDVGYVNPAWGSQVIMANVVDTPWLGLAGMQLLHTLLVMGCLLCVATAVKQRAAGLFSGIAAVFFLWINWQQFLVVRPQTFGLLFYCVLFHLLMTGRDSSRLGQVSVVLLFVCWANLHGSFGLGLFLIGMTGIGRLFEFAWRVWRLHRHARCLGLVWQILRRSGFVRLLFLGCLCVLATLLNPYGVAVYEEMFRVGRHPNMAQMIEWRPLSLDMKQGRAAAISFAVLIAVCLASWRRPKMPVLLLLVLTGILMIWSSRMINWWAPVAAFTIGSHAGFAGKRLRKSFLTKVAGEGRTSARLQIAVAVVALIVPVTFSHWGRQAQGDQIPDARILSRRTPFEAAEFLRNDSALFDSGRVFCPMEWTGYLMSETREVTKGGKVHFPLRPLVSTHVHVISNRLWRRYLGIQFGHRLTLKLLAFYKVNLVIVDLKRQKRLGNLLSETPDFELIFKSTASAIYVRR